MARIVEGRTIALLVAGLVLAYGLVTLVTYAATPLGRVPLLDAHENVELAREIAEQRLPHEPFYRAPGYAALLGGALRLGLPAGLLADFARLLNLFAHLVAVAYVAAIALRLWRSRGAGTLAAVLFGFYPVALHLAGDAQDTSVGVALFVAGVHAAMRAVDDEPGTVRRSAAAALWLGAATLVRPHYLLVLVAWCVVAVARAVPRGGPRGAAIATLFAAALPLAAMGAINAHVGGTFAVMPWQGAYNLWAANGPHANGRYFAQQLRIPAGERYENPARRESEALYRQETGAPAPVDRDAMNRHWRDRTVRQVFAHPIDWLALTARKAFFLAHDFEQYNNKTYALHRERSPWLALNPLGWGVLLVAAALALATVRAQDRRALAVLGLFAAVYAAGALLFFASDRFRFPLAPLAAAVAGGLALLPIREARRTPGVAAAGLAGVVAVAALAFWPLPRAFREETYKADYLLLAEAANEVGAYDEALRHADTARTLDGSDAGAAIAACLAAFNVAAARAGLVPLHAVPLAPARERCAHAAPFDERSRHAGAVLDWAVGDADRAVATWRELAAGAGPAKEMATDSLALAGLVSPHASADPATAALLGDADACRRLFASGQAGRRRVAQVAALYRIAAPACRKVD